MGRSDAAPLPHPGQLSAKSIDISRDNPKKSQGLEKPAYCLLLQAQLNPSAGLYVDHSNCAIFHCWYIPQLLSATLRPELASKAYLQHIYPTHHSW
jgi:hypothetical protein